MELPADTPEQCQDLCVAHKGCNSFTFTTEMFFGTPACFLKEAFMEGNTTPQFR